MRAKFSLYPYFFIEMRSSVIFFDLQRFFLSYQLVQYSQANGRNTENKNKIVDNLHLRQSNNFGSISSNLFNERWTAFTLAHKLSTWKRKKRNLFKFITFAHTTKGKRIKWMDAPIARFQRWTVSFYKTMYFTFTSARKSNCFSLSHCHTSYLITFTRLRNRI